MNSRRWSAEETARALALYRSGYASTAIAEMLGRTEASVRLKLLGMGYSSKQLLPAEADQDTSPLETLSLPSPKIAEAEPDSLEDIARRELEAREWRQAERAKIDEAKREILEDRIVAEFHNHLCSGGMPDLKISPPPVRPRNGTSPTAVLVLSDLHVGQTIDSREIENLGNYSPAVTVSRLHLMELEVARILKDRPIEKLLLLLAGDIVHGHLGHSMEDDLTIPIALQVDLALHLLFQFICRLSTLVPLVEIHGVAGNHGRWPGMRKMPTDRRWSNLDTIVYSSLSALCQAADLKNVATDERFSARRTIRVGNFTIELLHGDQIRGGGYCVSGMTREVTNATLRNLQAGRSAVDYFVVGDKHFSASLPIGSGAFIVNGSFVGVDPFGMNFIPSPPSQTLFFLDPLVGKTETHELRLQNARWPGSLPYQLKPTLEDLVLRHTTQA